MTNDRNLLTPKVNLKSKERLNLFVSYEDYVKVRRGRWKAVVTDLDTKVSYKLGGCSCGIPHCMCDAYVIGIIE